MKSYDVFDTLIIRWYKEPNSIFREMENIAKISNFCNIRKDAEFSLSDPNIEDIYKIIAKKNNFSVEKVEELKKLEIKLEHDMSSPIVKNMKLIEDGDVIVSDMYLSKDIILSLLKKNGLNKNINLYVSNNGKHNGWIWNTIKEKKQISLHTGDNYHSDVLSAKKNEINSFHFTEHEFSEKEKIMFKHNESIAYISRVLRLLNPFNNDTYGSLLWHEASAYTVPINLLLSNIVYNTFNKNKYENILFSTRDCYYLYDIFINLYPHLKEKCHIFHTSRKMYYLPNKEYVQYCKEMMNDSLVVDLQGSGKSFKFFCDNNHINSTLLTVVDTGISFENKLGVFNFKDHGLTDKIEKINYAPYGTLIDFKQSDVRAAPEYDINFLVPYNMVLFEANNLLKKGFNILNKNNEILMLELLKYLETDCVIEKIIQHVDNFVR